MFSEIYLYTLLHNSLPICHSSQLKTSHEQNRGNKPNHCYTFVLYEEKKSSKCLYTLGCKCNLYHVQNKWNVVAVGSSSELFQSVSLPPVRLGTISTSEPTEVKWQGLSKKPSYRFNHCHSHTCLPSITATLTRQPGAFTLLFYFDKMSSFINFKIIEPITSNKYVFKGCHHPILLFEL